MKCNGRILLVAIAAAAAASAFAISARADEEPLPEHFMLRVGGYEVRNYETLARLDSNKLPAGLYIDFGDTLGGETSARVGRLDGLYRFNDKHALGFSWYALNFSGHRRLETQIEWGDVVFPIGVDVDSENKYDVKKINYQYSLFHNEQAEIGALVGLHVMKASMSIEASGVGTSQSESVTAPLPVWGLFASYKFTPRFSIYYNYQFFFINYEDKIKGGLQDFLLGLEYRLFRNFAAGFALNRFGLNIESRKTDTTFYLDTNWTGGMLYGTLYF